MDESLLNDLRWGLLAEITTMDGETHTGLVARVWQDYRGVPIAIVVGSSHTVIPWANVARITRFDPER